MKIKKSQLILLIPIVIVLTAVVFWASDFNKDEKGFIGVVETEETDVASKIPGRIETIFVNEGDIVKKGTVLARLESKEIDAKVGQAKGVLKAAKSKLEMIENGARKEEIISGEKLLLQAKHQFEFASKTRERFVNLLRDSIISQQEFDEIDFKYNAAKDQMESADVKVSMLKSGARPEEKEAVKGLFDQAQNAYNEAMAYYKELEITAPIDGEISNKIADSGEIIASGYPIFSMINSKDNYVVIQVREDELSGMKIGQSFEGNIPALNNRKVNLKVTYISPMADFATWKPTNQKGDFDLKTFEIHLKSKKQIDDLRAGMTVKINL